MKEILLVYPPFCTPVIPPHSIANIYTFLKNNLDEKSELLQLQISKAYRDLSDSYEQIDIAKTSLIQSLAYQKELEDNYDAGITSTSDLLEARAITQQASDNLIDVKIQYKIKVANYLLVVGSMNQ